MAASDDSFIEKKRRVFDTVGYEPTPLQWEIHSSPATYRIVACGVRFGKSWLAAHEAIAALMQPRAQGWIVTPEHSLGKTIFQYIRDTLKDKIPPGFIVRHSDKDQYLVTALESRLEVKSANNKTSLAGAPLDFAIIDEAAKVDEEAMNLVHLRLMDKRGWFVAISSPDGKNWFHRAYLKGQDRESNPDWQSWNAPTWANPFIDTAEIEQRRADMPERLFRQTVGAEFIDDDGTVFKNVAACAIVRYTEKGDDHEKGPVPIAGRQYVVSADLGRHQDYTAIFVWDVKAKSAIHFDYWQGDWTAQIKRIKWYCQRYNRAALIVDATGEGDAVHERLSHENASEKFSNRVYGEKLYDARRKREIVEALILALENTELTFVNHPRVIRELGEYEFSRSPRNNTVTYSAPAGKHDDSVMSLALGWSLVGRLRSTPSIFTGKI